jgi:hypothetical protein
MAHTDELDSGTLATLIADAEQVQLPRVPLPRTIDLDAPPAPRTIVIPEATMTLLEDYELYVD